MDQSKVCLLYTSSAVYPQKAGMRSYKPSTKVHPGQIKKAEELLRSASRPLMLIGGGVRISNAGPLLVQFMERTGIPVVTTIMGKGAIPSDHDLYVGNIGIHGSFAANNAVNHCDVLLSIGTRSVSYTHLISLLQIADVNMGQVVAAHFRELDGIFRF